MGQIIADSIQAQAQELAKQFGTDPQQLARSLYAKVVANEPGASRGFLSGLGRIIAEVPTLGYAQTQNEAAQELLRQKYAQ